jgi:hypothetical protein
MFEGIKKERPLYIGPDTLKNLYDANPDSAFADNVRSLVEDLITQGDAERMLQEGAELDHEYVKTLEAIRDYLKSENYDTFDGLSSVEYLVLELISENWQDKSEAFTAYLNRLRKGIQHSKLNGM